MDEEIPTAMRDTSVGVASAKYQVQQRRPGYRNYEIKDHLGNVRTVISDIKNPFSTSGPVSNWTYLADIKNISNTYPYGKSYGTNAIYNAEDDYRFGFNGMEKAKEVNDNTLTSKYRNADLDFPIWWSRDPKESEAPSKSPYIMMGNNPIVMIDPNGDKEYVNLATYQFTTGYEKLGPNDWLKTDRELMNETFANANLYNLLNQLYSDYTEINQRYAFYQWFQSHTEEIGFQTQWAGAASKVAYDVEWLDTKLACVTCATNDELAEFANDGNEAIFVDVFPKLRKLYLGTGLQGEEARTWDFITLAEEQHLVQSIYNNLTDKNDRELLVNNVKRKDFWANLFANYFTETKAFFPNGNVFDVFDRWKYGVKNMGYNHIIFKMPEVNSKYDSNKNGGKSKSGKQGSKTK